MDHPDQVVGAEQAVLARRRLTGKTGTRRVLQHGQADARARVQGRTFRTEQWRVTLQRLGRVGRPETVIGVLHEVAAHQFRLAVERHQAVTGAPYPVVARSVAVEQREAGVEQLVVRRTGGSLEIDHAEREQRQVGHRRAVDVERIALVVGIGRVDPQRAATILEYAAELVQVGRACHLQPGVQQAVGVGIGVPVGIRLAGGSPGRQAAPGHGIRREHRAVLGEIEGPLERHRRGRPDVHFDLEGLRSDGALGEILDVGEVVAGLEREFVECEATAGGHRVGPAEVFIEANQRDRRAEQAGPADIQVARHGHLAFVETSHAGVGKVRVRQQRAAAILAQVAADAPGVTRQAGLEVGVTLGDVVARVHDGVLHQAHRLRTHARGDRHRRRILARRYGNEYRAGGEQVAAGVLRDDAIVRHEVGGLDFEHPRTIAALRGQVGGIGVTHVLVVAGGEAAHQRAAGRRHLRIVFGRAAADALRDVAEVVDDVNVARARTEIFRPLAACFHEGVGQVADHVLGLHIAHAERRRLEVVGHDVRDAVGRATNRRLRPAGRRVDVIGRGRRLDDRRIVGTAAAATGQQDCREQRHCDKRAAPTARSTMMQNIPNHI